MNENEFENVMPETEETIADEAVETVQEKETVEELSDETVDTIQEGEIVEESTDEVMEDVAVQTDDSISEDTEAVEEIITEKKKTKTPVIILAIVVIVALIATIICVSFGGNKYNKMGYANPSDRTIDQVCEELGITLEEFKKNYELPEDMTGDTEEMAAYYMIPVKVFSQMYGIDYATFKESYNIPDETTPSEPTTILGKIKALFGIYDIQPIDENTPWGIVLDELTLANYVGEENIETFKEYYGITDEITGETKYKEIRKQVEAKEAELVAEANAAQEQDETETTDNAAVETETETEVSEDIQTEETAE